MEVTSWNFHHGSYQVQLTLWKVPDRPNYMEVSKWNLCHGSYLMELTP